MTYVLLLEPDPKISTIISKYISRDLPEISVLACSSSQTAISKADEQKPDLVILELSVPGQNGLAFLQEFRSYTDWMSVPVIIHSHIPLENSGLLLQDWERQGVVAYLYKPTTQLADLARVIKQHINHEATQR